MISITSGSDLANYWPKDGKSDLVTKKLKMFSEPFLDISVHNIGVLKGSNNGECEAKNYVNCTTSDNIYVLKKQL